MKLFRFIPGDRALCIISAPYPPSILESGVVYTVRSTDGSCCIERLLLEETRKPWEGKDVCAYCGKPCNGFAHWRFIKLIPDIEPDELELEQPATVKVPEKVTT